MVSNMAVLAKFVPRFLFHMRILLRNNWERIRLIQETPANQPTNKSRKTMIAYSPKVNWNYLRFLSCWYFIDWGFQPRITIVKHRGWLPMSPETIHHIYMTAPHNWIGSTYSPQLMPLLNGPLVRFFALLVAWDSSAIVCHFTFFGKSPNEIQFKECM